MNRECGTVHLDKDVQRLAAAVDDMDRIRTWILLRKITYVIACGYKPGEEELKNLIQALEKLRGIITPRDVAIACDALCLIETMVVCSDRLTLVGGVLGRELVSELIRIHRDYTQMLTGSGLGSEVVEAQRSGRARRAG